MPTKPSFPIANLRAEDLSFVPVSRHESGWRLPDGTIFLAEFRKKSTRLSLPDWGFTIERDNLNFPELCGIVSTTTFARQAGTLIATRPVPAPDDLAAGAERLAADFQGAFGAPALTCRLELAAFIHVLLSHLLTDYGPDDALAEIVIPTAPTKTGILKQIRLPKSQIPIPGRILIALAGTARSVRNGQAKPLGNVWIRPPASAHARAEATLRLVAAEARTGIALTDWIAAQPVP